MSKVTNFIFGSKRIVSYSGAVTEFGDELAAAALEDPELERQITVAALSLQYTRTSRHLGQLMIDEILKPETK